MNFIISIIVLLYVIGLIPAFVLACLTNEYRYLDRGKAFLKCVVCSLASWVYVARARKEILSDNNPINL